MYKRYSDIMKINKKENWFQENSKLSGQVAQQKRVLAKTQNELNVANKVVKDWQKRQTKWDTKRDKFIFDIQKWTDHSNTQKDEINQLKKDKQALAKQVKAKPKVTKTADPLIKTLQNQIKDKNKEIKDKDKEIKDKDKKIKKKDEQIITLDNQVTFLTNESNELEEKMQQEVDKVKDYTKNETELNDAKKKLKEQSTQITNLFNDSTLANNKLLILQTEHKDLLKNFNKITIENDQYKVEAEELNDDLSDVRNKMGQAAITINKNKELYDTKINQANKQIETLKKQVQDLKSENTILGDRIQDMLKPQKSKKDTVIVNQKDIIDLLKDQLEKMRNEKDAIQIVHNKMKKKFIGDIGDLNIRLTTAIKDADRYTDLYNNVIKNAKVKAKLITRLQESVKSKSNQVKIARDIYLKNKSNLIDCEDELANCKNELAKCLKENERLQKEITSKKKVNPEPKVPIKNKRKRTRDTMSTEIPQDKEEKLDDNDNTNIERPKKRQKTNKPDKPKFIKRTKQITPPKQKIKVESPRKRRMQLRPNTKKIPTPLRPNEKLEIAVTSPDNKAAQRNEDLRVQQPNESNTKLSKIEDVIHGKDDEIEMKQTMPDLEDDPDMNTNKEDKDDKEKKKRNDGAGKLGLYAGNFRGNKIIGLYDKY